MGIPDEEIQDITNEYLDEVEENLEIELAEFRGEGWTIKDKEMAMKIDYVIHKMEEKIIEDETIADNQKQILQDKIDKLEEGKTKLDSWLERSTKAYKSNIVDLKTHLQIYHRRVLHAEELENEKRIANNKKPLKLSKTIKLTYRDLTSKVQLPEIIKDDEKLSKWVEDNHSDTISCLVLTEFLAEKENREEDSITVNELMELIKDIDSKYISRETKLAWAEFKKTLTQQEINIKQLVNDQEVIVGTKLVYFDENGQEVPHVNLIPKEDKFDVKMIKE